MKFESLAGREAKQTECKENKDKLSIGTKLYMQQGKDETDEQTKGMTFRQNNKNRKTDKHKIERKQYDTTIINILT